MRLILTSLLLSTLVLLVPRAEAFDLEEALKELHPQFQGAATYHVAQRDGLTLSQATELVRRRTNGRVVSAETRVQGGREVHYIKVLTKDGRVKTHTVQGRRR